MSPAPNQNKPTTQDHLDILEIVDNLILLKNGGCCTVVQTTTVNFGLLSETEQDSLIYAYASFLNSLSFPIQVLVRSQKKDVTAYIKYLAKREKAVTSPLIKQRISTYRRFVEYIVQENEVLDKNFYLIIPFSPLEAGFSGGGIMGKNRIFSDKDKAYIVEKAKSVLAPKKEHIVSQLARLGLKSKILTTEELIKLFFTIYNPDMVGQAIPSPAELSGIAVRPGINQANLPNSHV